jgi:hypothetical protein
MSMKEPAMTEQPPSASSEWQSTPEAKEAAYELRCRLGHNQRSNFDADRIIAYALDRFAEQRVSAETERWQNRDHQRLEQIERLQETVQSLQSARDERPAPPQRHLTGGEREVLHKALLASSTLVHSGDAKQTRPSDLTQDYTERARELLRRIGDAHGRETQSRYYEDNKPSVKLVVDALSTVASEREAIADAQMELVKACEHIAEGTEGWGVLRNLCPSCAAVASLRDAYESRMAASEHDAMRAFGQRVWSDTEEVAYQAGAADTEKLK